MSSSVCGVEVCLEDQDGDVPECPHGPALLFERFYGGPRSSRKFYACSAHRDRSQCPFFQWADVKISKMRKQARAEHNKALQPPLTHEQYYSRYKKALCQASGERQFCQDCDELVVEEQGKHRSHNVISPIERHQLDRPTTLMAAKEQNKAQAQYLFSDNTEEFVLNCLEKVLKVDRVLCLGTPRIHEAIQRRHRLNPPERSEVDSLLLDIDHRFYQFYDPEHFCRYNMFNHHFFDGSNCETTFKKFMGRTGTVAIMFDPPFGGLVEVLAATLRKIFAAWRQDLQGVSESEECPVFLFFPYFMEPRIVSCLPTFTMLDYKVDYDNHTTFQSSPKGRKQGSPVRIFTNVDPARVILPADEGYRLCKPCQRYVSAENRHCDKCKACTSKDGRQYVHCDKCERCVKPTKVHCESCNRCEFPDHTCGQTKSAGCHICGDLSHKRRNCPNKAAMSQKDRRKRQQEDDKPQHQKAKKFRKNKKCKKKFLPT